MATLATGARTQLRYIKETVFGTVPTTGTGKKLRRTSDSLEFKVTTATSEEIRDDRQTTDLVPVSASAEGAVNFELSYKEYDDLLESVLQSTWNTNVLTNGTTQTSFTIEREHGDIGQFLAFRGMTPSKLELSMQSGSIVTGSISFMGQDQMDPKASTNLPGVATDSQTFDIMNAVSGVGAIKEGGALLTGTFIKSLTLSVDNALRGRDAIGVLGNVDIGAGTLAVTGNMSVYFANATLYNKFLKGFRTSLEWECSDALGNKYKFELPSVKFSEASIQSGDKNSDSMVEMTYTAIMDPVSKKTIRITRTTATP